MKIENSNLLKGLSLIDFSTRLPGPLASSFLQDLGATIYRPYELNESDSFNNHKDQAFKYWFQSLSKGKVIVNEIESLFEKVDGIITTWSQTQLHEDLIKSRTNPFVIIEIQASNNKNKKSLHDLNSFAESGLLRLKISSEQMTPPCLPMAGIQFANQIALSFLAGLYKSKSEKKPIKIGIALDEVVHQLAKFLLPPSGSQFLHNGKFPCYQIYKTQIEGQFLIVAAIETKFWIDFTRFIGMDDLQDKQFSDDPRIINKISSKIKTFSQIELSQMCIDQKCLSLIRID